MKLNKLPSIEVLLSMSEEELTTLCFGSVKDENYGLDCSTCPYKEVFCGGHCLDLIKEYMAKTAQAV